jgi:hypothetical protein
MAAEDQEAFDAGLWGRKYPNIAASCAIDQLEGRSDRLALLPTLQRVE